MYQVRPQLSLIEHTLIVNPGTYIASNTDIFTLECDYYWQQVAANALNGNGETVASFRACLDLCSVTTNCMYISYYRQTNLFHLLDALWTGGQPGGAYIGFDRASLAIP